MLQYRGMKAKEKLRGQAILEYILLIVMISVTVAITIRNTNRSIYGLWTGLVRQVASPCPDCVTDPAPDIEGGAANEPAGN